MGFQCYTCYKRPLSQAGRALHVNFFTCYKIGQKSAETQAQWALHVDFTTCYTSKLLNNMSEDKIQQEIIMYYRNYYQRLYVNCLIFSIPNGGLRDKRTAMLMKSTGLLSGASDLIVIHFGAVMFVELKTDTGIQSDEQKAFQLRVNQCGYPYYLCRSLEQFKQILSLS